MPPRLRRSAYRVRWLHRQQCRRCRSHHVHFHEHHFHLSASGPDGAWFRIEYSTNLRDWTAICNNQVIQGSIDFVDPDAQGDQTRLYRAVPVSGPPAE